MKTPEQKAVESVARKVKSTYKRSVREALDCAIRMIDKRAGELVNDEQFKLANAEIRAVELWGHSDNLRMLLKELEES